MNQEDVMIIFGRVGKMPELKFTQKQTAVCEFSLAEEIKGHDQVRWHKVIVWGKQAEHCSVMLKKGALVFVRGQKMNRQYTNAQGEIKQYSEFKADLAGFPML